VADADREAQGEKRRGRDPKPVSEEPASKAQANFTDPEAKIMKNGKAFDNSYFSEDNVRELEDLGFDPHISTGRQKHNTPSPTETSGPPPESATATERMTHNLLKIWRSKYALS